MGCETRDGKLVLVTAAVSTESQAERLVALILGKSTQRLIFTSAEIDRPLERMRSRWPQLVVELKRGSIGMTEDGLLRIRQAEGRVVELKKLVRAENFDRQMLYRGICAEVGYAEGHVFHWMPFTEDAFGKEWIKQAPVGWWMVDAEGHWQRKEKPVDTP